MGQEAPQVWRRHHRRLRRASHPGRDWMSRRAAARGPDVLRRSWWADVVGRRVRRGRLPVLAGRQGDVQGLAAPRSACSPSEIG